MMEEVSRRKDDHVASIIAPGDGQTNDGRKGVKQLLGLIRRRRGFIVGRVRVGPQKYNGFFPTHDFGHCYNTHARFLCQLETDLQLFCWRGYFRVK